MVHGPSVCCKVGLLKGFAKGKDVFLDFENSYDTIDRHGM